MAAVTPVPGVIRSARSVYWEEERGWIPVGKWIPGGGFAEEEMTVIRVGTDGDDNWIVSEGGGFEFEAEIALTCVLCGIEITPETATPEGVCTERRHDDIR